MRVALYAIFCLVLFLSVFSSSVSGQWSATGCYTVSSWGTQASCNWGDTLVSGGIQCPWDQRIYWSFPDANMVTWRGACTADSWNSWPVWFGTVTAVCCPFRNRGNPCSVHYGNINDQFEVNVGGGTRCDRGGDERAVQHSWGGDNWCRRRWTSRHCFLFWCSTDLHWERYPSDRILIKCNKNTMRYGSAIAGRVNAHTYDGNDAFSELVAKGYDFNVRSGFSGHNFWVDRFDIVCEPVPRYDYGRLNIQSQWPEWEIIQGQTYTITCRPGYYTFQSVFTCNAFLGFNFFGGCAPKSCGVVPPPRDSAGNVLAGASWSTKSNQLLYDQISFLSCPVGYSPEGDGTTRCILDQFGNAIQSTTRPICTAFVARNAVATPTSRYAFDFTWQPALATGITKYAIYYTHIYPTFSSLELSSNPAFLSGIKTSGALNDVPAGGPFRVSITSDSLAQIAGIQADIAITPYTAASVGSTTVVRVQLPCACDIISSAIDGVVQQFSVSQDVYQNTVSVRFLPNSLCAMTYRVSIANTTFPVINSTIDTYRIGTYQNCQFRSVISSTVATIDGVYLRPGVKYTYFVNALPMSTCASCVSQYAVGASFGVAQLDFIANFTFQISGKVTTPLSPASPSAIGIENIILTVSLYDLSDVNFLTPLWNQTFVTDLNGIWRGVVSTATLSRPPYLIRVVPSRQDSLTDGSTFTHTFRSSYNASSSVYVSRAGIAEMIEEVNFEDTSTVDIKGRVVLDFYYSDEQGRRIWNFINPIVRATNPSTPPSAISQSANCGIPDIQILGYAATDVNLEKPLFRSLPSDNDGNFIIASIIYTNLVLVPVYQPAKSNSADVPIHTFSPASIPVRVETEPINLAPIVDTTMAVFNFSFYGGVTRSHIGAIRPVLSFPTCSSTLNRIPLALAGNSKDTNYDPINRVMQYKLPAQSFQVFWQLDISGFQTGFQAAPDNSNPFQYKTDVNGDWKPVPSTDPYFVFSDVTTWINTLSNIQIDLTNGSYAYALQYFAPPIATLPNPPSKSRSCFPDQDGGFLVLDQGANYTTQFEVTETYGPASSPSNPTFIYRGYEINTNVSATFVVFSDGFSPSGAALTVDSPGSCDNQVCSVPVVYQPDAKKSYANYTFTAGPVEISPSTASGIPFARGSFYYANSSIASSGLLNRQAQHNLYAVITGILTYPASLQIEYPPTDALYILRDPPGGDSFASIQAGTRLTSAITISGGGNLGFGANVGGGPEADPKTYLCVGLGAATCTETTEGGIETEAKFEIQHEFDFGQEHTNTFSYEFNEIVTTSDDPSDQAPNGDVFLTLAGSISVSQSIIIAVTNPQCVSSSTPQLTWNWDSRPTLHWISVDDILNLIIPDLTKEVNLLIGQLGYTDYNDFVAHGSAPKARSQYPPTMTDDQYSKLGTAAKQITSDWKSINDWQGLVNYNEYLKATAVKFVDFYQHIGSNGRAPKYSAGTNPWSDPTYLNNKIASDAKPGASAQYLNPAEKTVDGFSAPSQTASFSGAASSGVMKEFLSYILTGVGFAEAPLIIAKAIAPNAFIPKQKNSLLGDAGLVTDDQVGSITFGSVALDYELTTTLEAVDASEWEKALEISGEITISGGVKVFGFGLDASGGYSGSLNFHHGLRNEISKELSNKITIHLGDPDPYDNFKIQILKDSVYGSPVYKVLAGKSRCMNETGTLWRDEVDFQLADSSIRDVPPNDPVATTLTLINKSPTGDSFYYSLTVDEASNRNGLTLSINGVILNTERHNFLVWLPYLQAVTLVLEARRSVSAGYSFNNMNILLRGYSEATLPSETICYEISRTISINYLSPCPQAQFVGKYISTIPYIINSDDGPSVPIAIYNPEAKIPWRTWQSNAAAGKLLNIYIEYRPVESTERGWIPANDYTTGLPVSIALPQTTSDPNQDFFLFQWNVGSLLPGEYLVRTHTQCTLVSSTDSSLNSFYAPQLRGRVDKVAPRVFGTPFPSVYEKYFPTAKISVTFTEPIQCKNPSISYWVTNTNRIAYAYSYIQAAQNNAIRVADFLCDSRGETLEIEFRAPDWAYMQEKVVTVFVASVKDLAENSLDYLGGNSVSWSFIVANFTTLKPFIRGYADTMDLSSFLGSGNATNSPASIAIELAIAANLNSLISQMGVQQSTLDMLHSELVDLMVTETNMNISDQIQLTLIQSKLDSLNLQHMNLTQLIQDNQLATANSLSGIQSIVQNSQKLLVALNNTVAADIQTQIVNIQTSLNTLATSATTQQNSLNTVLAKSNQLLVYADQLNISSSVQQSSIQTVIQSVQNLAQNQQLLEQTMNFTRNEIKAMYTSLNASNSVALDKLTRLETLISNVQSTLNSLSNTTNTHSILLDNLSQLIQANQITNVNSIAGVQSIVQATQNLLLVVNSTVTGSVQVQNSIQTQIVNIQASLNTLTTSASTQQTTLNSVLTKSNQLLLYTDQLNISSAIQQSSIQTVIQSVQTLTQNQQLLEQTMNLTRNEIHAINTVNGGGSNVNVNVNNTDILDKLTKIQSLISNVQTTINSVANITNIHSQQLNAIVQAIQSTTPTTVVTTTTSISTNTGYAPLVDSDGNGLRQQIESETVDSSIVSFDAGFPLSDRSKIIVVKKNIASAGNPGFNADNGLKLAYSGYGDQFNAVWLNTTANPFDISSGDFRVEFSWMNSVLQNGFYGGAISFVIHNDPTYSTSTFAASAPIEDGYGYYTTSQAIGPINSIGITINQLTGEIYFANYASTTDQIKVSNSSLYYGTVATDLYTATVDYFSFYNRYDVTINRYASSAPDAPMVRSFSTSFYPSYPLHNYVKSKQVNVGLTTTTAGMQVGNNSLPVSVDTKCGVTAGTKCPAGYCCSSAGWCGTTPAYCGSGCQSTYSQNIDCNGGITNWELTLTRLIIKTLPQRIIGAKCAVPYSATTIPTLPAGLSDSSLKIFVPLDDSCDNVSPINKQSTGDKIIKQNVVSCGQSGYAGQYFNGYSSGVTVVDYSGKYDFTDFSVSIWINPDYTNSSPRLKSFVGQRLEANTRWSLHIDSLLGSLSVWHGALDSFGFPAGFTLKSNTWTHIVYTYNHTGLTHHRLYYNSSVSSDEGTSAITAGMTNLPFDIGYNSYLYNPATKTDITQSEDFLGRLALVQFYNRALSAGEVSQLFSSTTAILTAMNQPTQCTSAQFTPTTPINHAQTIPTKLRYSSANSIVNSYTGRFRSRSVKYNNKIYMFGGESRLQSIDSASCTVLNDAWSYDGNANNDWVQLTSNTRFAARSSHATVVAIDARGDSRVYLFGGKDCTGNLMNDMWKSGVGNKFGLDWTVINTGSLGNSWSLSAATMGPSAGFSYTYDPVYNHIYAARSNTSMIGYNYIMRRFDPVTEAWSNVGPATNLNQYAGGVMELIGRSIYIFGGSAADPLAKNYLTSVMVKFDLTSFTYTTISDSGSPFTMNSIGYGIRSAVVGNRIYVTPGIGNNGLNLYTAVIDANRLPPLCQSADCGLYWNKVKYFTLPDPQADIESGELQYLESAVSLVYFAYSPVNNQSQVYQACLLATENCPTPNEIVTNSYYPPQVPSRRLLSMGEDNEESVKEPSKPQIKEASTIAELRIHSLISHPNSVDPATVYSKLDSLLRDGSHLDSNKYPVLSGLIHSEQYQPIKLKHEFQPIVNFQQIHNEAALENYYPYTKASDQKSNEIAFSKFAISKDSLLFYSTLNSNSETGNLYLTFVQSGAQSQLIREQFSFTFSRIFHRESADLESVRLLASKDSTLLAPLTILGSQTEKYDLFVQYNSSSNLRYYTFYIKDLRTTAGGAEYLTEIDYNKEKLFSIPALYIVGPPTSVYEIVEIKQLPQFQLQLQFIPALHSGLINSWIQPENPESIQYFISVNEFHRIPSNFIQFAQYTPDNDATEELLPHTQTVANIDLLGLNQTFPGIISTDKITKFSVQSVTLLGSSPKQSVEITLLQANPAIHIKSLLQIESNKFELIFPGNNELKNYRIYFSTSYNNGKGELIKSEYIAVEYNKQDSHEIIAHVTIPSLPVSKDQTIPRLYFAVSECNCIGEYSALEFIELVPYVTSSNVDKFNVVLFDSSACKVEVELFAPASVYPSTNYFYGWLIEFNSADDTEPVHMMKIPANKSSNKVVSIDLPVSARSVDSLNIHPLMFNSLNYVVRAKSGSVKLIQGTSHSFNQKFQCKGQ